MDVKKSKKNLKFTTIAWIMAAMLLIIIIPVNIDATIFTGIIMISSIVPGVCRPAPDGPGPHGPGWAGR